MGDILIPIFLSKTRFFANVPKQTMSNLLDQYLLFRVRTRRDPEAFTKLYDRYVSAIYRFVFLKVPTKETAEDITSETFLKCWQAVLQQKEVWHVRALLYRIARNLIADVYRKAGPVESLDASVTFLEEVTSTHSERDISDKKRGQRQIEAQTDVHLVLEAVKRLKEDYQDVVTLRLIDDLPFDDIARILEKKPGAVRVIFHRAMKKLDDLVNSET